MLELTYLFDKYSKNGYIVGDRIRELFLQFPISRKDLALIWELADTDRDGKLTFEEFCTFVRFTGERVEQSEEINDPELDLLIEEHEFWVEENHRLTTKIDILMKNSEK